MNLKLIFLGKRYGEVPIAADPRYKHYKAKEDHIFLEDGLELKI